MCQLASGRTLPSMPRTTSKMLQQLLAVDGVVIVAIESKECRTRVQLRRSARTQLQSHTLNEIFKYTTSLDMYCAFPPSHEVNSHTTSPKLTGSENASSVASHPDSNAGVDGITPVSTHFGEMDINLRVSLTGLLMTLTCESRWYRFRQNSDQCRL